VFEHGCEHCPRSFPSAAKLTAHIQWGHPELKVVGCSLCAFRCRDAKNLREHMRRKHTVTTEETNVAEISGESRLGRSR
jgi:hypothetical protein